MDGILFVANTLGSVLGSRKVLSDGYHSEIIAVFMYRSVNAFLNAFCTCLNFFHQKFWMSYIPGSVQFFGLANSFFIFSSGMAISLTRFSLLTSSVFTSSIHNIFGVGSFSYQMPPQNSTNLCISGISLSRFPTASRVQKRPFRSRWNMILCFFQLRISMYFFNFTFL